MWDLFSETEIWCWIDIKTKMKYCVKSFLKDWPLRNQDSEAYFIQLGFVLYQTEQ